MDLQHPATQLVGGVTLLGIEGRDRRGDALNVLLFVGVMSRMISAIWRIETSLCGDPILKIWRSHTPPGFSTMRAEHSTASSMYV